MASAVEDDVALDVCRVAHIVEVDVCLASNVAPMSVWPGRAAPAYEIDTSIAPQLQGTGRAIRHNVVILENVHRDGRHCG